MATHSSPEFIQRRPVGSNISPVSPESPRFFRDGESTDTYVPKPLPVIPGQASGSAAKFPPSPTKYNQQPEVWQRASNSYVGGDENRAQMMPYEQDGSRRYENDPRIVNQAAMQSEEPADEWEEDQEPAPVPQLQYHHQAVLSEASNGRSGRSGRAQSTQNQYAGPTDAIDAGQSINRHLTPTSQTARRTPQIQRPISAYSDSGVRHSPLSQARATSAQSGRSNEGNGRPMSFMDLNNVSYPQMPPAPISLDNSQLRGIVGSQASLLSTQKTLEMYRQNIKKLNDPETQYAFAVFLVSASSEAAEEEKGAPKRKGSPKRQSQSPRVEESPPSAQELLEEAKQILQKLADRSYPFAQYYLADGYASGLFSKNKEEDNASAFPLFVSASKHGHAEAGYRAALCYEFGWGCRRDPAKAVQFLRHAASKNHPGAMTRLGRACLSGDLGENKYREGVKWLKRATDAADLQYNAAPFHLGQLYERGCGDDIFVDEAYAAQLFTQAADLGHAEAAFRLGDAYEHGKLLCPRDPALSIHFYTGAAQRGHAGAMMALCAWYMIGAEPVLEKDENEAYEWAREAALKGLTKAEYAVGYFTEMGIGTRRDPLEANVWYVKAAAAGDDRAKIRIAAINAAASGGAPRRMDAAPAKNNKIKKVGSGNDKVVQKEKEKEKEKVTAGDKEKDCIVM